MAPPPAFKDLGKVCSDLLSKDYKTGKSTVELKTKTPAGLTLTPNGSKNDKGAFSGSLELKYAVAKGVEATATLNTSGSVDATCEATDLLTKGLVAKLETSTASNGGLLSKALATFDFKQELFTAKASYEVYKGDAHAALSTAALSGFMLGGSVDYSTQKGALTKYAAAGQFVQPEFTLCAKLSEAVGKPAGMTFAGSYFHKVSAEMQVGAELSKAMNKSDVSLAFGCAYKLDKDTTVKSKVDSDGMLFGSYKAKISPMSTLTLATQIDTVKLAENNHKFGLELKIEP